MGQRGINSHPIKRKRRTFKASATKAILTDRIAINIDFIEKLPITSGILAETQFKLRPFQREIIEQIYREDATKHRFVRQALITMPRKNGKTGLTAALALLHFCGPEAIERGQIYSAAAERQQAALLFNEMKAIIERVSWLRKRVIIRDFTKQLEDAETGSVYFALSAEATTKHGFSTNCWIYDELAQAKDRKLYDVLQTSTSAHKEPLGIVISTQSHDPNHIMSELVDYGLRINSGEITDPAFYASIYAAPEEADPWSEKTWFDCNPALGDFRSLEEMQSSALQAQRMPAREPSFRLLYLNQRVQAEASLINRAEWVRCQSQDAPLLKPGEDIFLGLDLSMVNDLSALVACSATNGDRLKAWFWKPGSELEEHERRDKVPYQLWAQQGWIEAPKGKTVNFAFIAKRLAEICEDYRVVALAYDRWAMKNLKRELTAIGLRYYEEGKEDKGGSSGLCLVPWAQTFQDMSPAIAALETAVLSDQLRHDGNPVLAFCMANAVVDFDAAGNRKLDKKATRYRIDGAVAASMAIGLESEERQDARTSVSNARSGLTQQSGDNMPDPMAGESRDDFMQRCIPQVMDDGTAEDQDQAVAASSSMFGDRGIAPLTRGHALMEIKSVNEDERTFEGIASTIVTDRMDDIVESRGARIKLPVPLKWQHGKGFMKDPVGWVTHATVNDTNIPIKAKFAKLDSPPSLKEDLDRAFALVKSGLVRFLSIGFNPYKAEPIKDSYGLRYTDWKLLEVSCTDIPANPESAITSVKSAYARLLAINSVKSADALALSPLGPKKREPVRLDKTANLLGVPGLTRKSTMTVIEQITQYENTRAAKAARMDELMTLAAKDGRTLLEAESTEYDTLKSEVSTVDEHLVRLRAHEATLKQKAVAVTDTQTTSGVTQTQRSPITVTRNLPKGIAFARYVIALYQSGNNKQIAADIARERCKDTPEVEMVLKTEVAAGTTTGTTWAAPLMPANTTLYGEFLDLLRKASILDRIPGVRYVPFNVNVPAQDGGATFLWVGEANPKPMSPLSFATVTLPFHKVAGIVAVSKELLRFSNPSAEQIVTNSMVKDCASYIDSQLLLETVHLSTNVNPASLTSGVTPKVASGLTAAAFRADLATQLAVYTTANDSIADIILALPESLAISMSLMRNALGTKEWPDLTFTGGSIEGIPVIISNNVSSGEIDFIKGGDILVADGGVEIDMSQEASLVFTTTPASSPAATELVSLFQRNLVGIRVEKMITWKKGRSHSVQRITSAAYSS